jgi:hypothetical protein
MSNYYRSILNVQGSSFTNTKSILLDGVDDFVNIGNISSLNNTSTFSISCWFKTNNISSQTFLWSQGSGSSQLFGASIFQDDLIVYSGSTTKFFRKNNLFNTSDWFNLVVVYDGSLTNAERIKLYLDGSLLTGVTVSSTTGSSTPNFTTDAKIGTLGYASGFEFDGVIDEFSIYSTALTQTDVDTIYGSGVPSDVSSISGITNWYRCGDGDTAPTLTDNIGSNNGTMVNFSTFSTDVPGSFTNTKSVRFDGIDDYIRISDADNLSFGDGSTDSPFSISAWANFTDISSGGIFAKLNTSSRREYGFYISSSKVRFLLYSQGTNTKYIGRRNNTALTSYENQWIHLLATYDGSSLHSGLKIYLNGTRIDDTDVSQGSYIAMQNDAADAFIGRHLTSYTEGAMDEVAIFSSELSASDVTAIYNSGLPTDLSSYSSLVSWWRMGDGDTFPTLTDNGSGGNNGTMTNMTSGNIVSDVPT